MTYQLESRQDEGILDDESMLNFDDESILNNLNFENMDAEQIFESITFYGSLGTIKRHRKIHTCTGACIKYQCYRDSAYKNKTGIYKRNTIFYKCSIKHCNLCNRYIDFEGYICPCCKEQLRSRSRSNGQVRIKYRKRMRNKCGRFKEY